MQTDRGHKQSGHLVARNDHISDARKSITVVTSTYSSGHGGPLGICIPDHFLAQKEIDDFNRQHTGECFIFRSQSTTHFMCGESFLTLLHGLIGPSLVRQRQRWKLPENTPALLLCDAWTGFHSQLQGLDCARQAWAAQNHCLLPTEQAGHCYIAKKNQ